MSEPVSAPDSARLDELARTTAEYAAYSRTAYGAAAVVTGLAVLAALALDVAGSDFASLDPSASGSWSRSSRSSRFPSSPRGSHAPGWTS